jgi:hypothetical protein
MYSRNTKTTNNKSDRPQVNIWYTWKTLKYLNINDSFHLKDLEISKYKRESKARMLIQFCCLIFVNCGLFSFLSIKKVNNIKWKHCCRWKCIISLIIFKNLQLECILHYLKLHTNNNNNLFKCYWIHWLPHFIKHYIHVWSRIK